MDLNLRPISPQDIQQTVKLIEKAMNTDEANWAAKCLNRYFESLHKGISDGRKLWVVAENNTIIAVTGLHHYVWGPEENIWLSWFAVEPSCQKKGIGRKLLKNTEQLAVKLGYKKLFIETYKTEHFAEAIKFYKKNGFLEIGSVDNYLSNGEKMLVFLKELKQEAI